MLIAGILFAIIFLTIIGCVGLGTSYFRSKQKQQISAMLRKAEATPSEQRSELLRPAHAEDRLAKLLQHFRFNERLALAMEQAALHWSATKLLVLSGIAFGVGFFIGHRIGQPTPAVCGAGIGLLLGSLPSLWVWRKRKKNFQRFEEQLAEALDFLSRSMRAGHGFSVALEMLAADAPDPLGGAFRRISNDLQLGSTLETALGKLNVLMPMLDVQFFTSAVLLQQETGGNLGEILSKLAFIIRERFRVRGQVKAASAHGRITGLVLVLMPVGVTVFMMVISPQYLRDLAADPVGRIMIWGAIGAQVVGYFVIQKIINIKV